VKSKNAGRFRLHIRVFPGPWGLVVAALWASGLVCAVLVLCFYPARADEVSLKSGEKIEGKIVEETDDYIRLEIEGKAGKGSRRINRSEIASIEKKKTPREEFTDRFLAISSDDAEGFYKLGVWAKKKGLVEQANLAFDKALEVNPEHLKAGMERGLIFIDGRWQSAADFQARADAFYRQKKYAEGAKILEGLINQPADKLNSLVRKQVLLNLCKYYEALGRWQDALDAYDRVMKFHPTKEERFLIQAKKRIISEHMDGKFNCAFDKTLFKDQKQQKAAHLLGEQPLSRPDVMRFALRMEARKIIEEAEKIAARAREEEENDPEAADKLYEEAYQKALEADILVPDISKQARLSMVLARCRMLDAQAARQQKVVQQDVGYTARTQSYPGDRVKADQYLAKVRRLYDIYRKKLELLRPFVREAAKEINKTVQGYDKAENLLLRAEEMRQALCDADEIETLRQEASRAAAKATASDPHKHRDYGVNEFKGSSGLYEFKDKGELWRTRSDYCIKYCDEALEKYARILQLMRKYPNLYSREMYYVKLDMDKVLTLKARAVIDRGRKGTDRYPGRSGLRWPIRWR